MMTDQEGSGPDPLARYPTPAERDDGQLPEPDLYENIPAHMDLHLRQWVTLALTSKSQLARTVATRCRLSWTATRRDSSGRSLPLSSPAVLNRIMAGNTSEITSPHPLDRLTIVDAIINLHPDWDGSEELDGGYSVYQGVQDWASLLVDLDTLLRDCGSAWYVNTEFRGLYRRVDPTATQAWKRARQAATDTDRVQAARYLADAWQELYGQHPDPSAGYAAAVKAVEAAVLPVVFPDRKAQGKTPTVHQARNQLRDRGQQWRFTLAETDGVPAGDGSIDIVAAMLDRLLRGETDRHADDHNRPSEQAEAEAAVHLAVLLVQWFVTGAIQRRN